MILFSVIIPTYNRLQFLKEAIDSVLNQTYNNFELIIVDDGSTDGTSEFIINEYKKDARINFYFKENEERGAARNYGLNKAKGTYAVFFDSDDWMKPQYLEYLHNVIIKQPVPPDMVAAKYIFRNNEGAEWVSTMKELTEGWYNINVFLKGNFLACNF